MSLIINDCLRVAFENLIIIVLIFAYLKVGYGLIVDFGMTNCV